MSRLRSAAARKQGARLGILSVYGLAACWLATCWVSSAALGQDSATRLPVENSEARAQDEMKAYVEAIEHTDWTIDLVPIPGGQFNMGSPAGEMGREADEGPQHPVRIAPFWMSKYEITWEAFEVWMFDLDIQRRDLAKKAPNARDKAADEFTLTQPTAPYTDMTFGMGKKGYPAICMTQLAARTFCDWLSAKTGRYYRLPTEAEWEYACRAGSTTAYSFGNDDKQLGEFAWYFDNSGEKYHPVGKKKPNAWGLYDMHGNVAEWVLDQYSKDFYGSLGKTVVDSPLNWPNTEWGRVVRGGSWMDDPGMLRSAARLRSVEQWKQQDPQIPKSIWYLTDALHVGFRIVRPLEVPTAAERKAKWDRHEPFQDRKAGR